MLKHQLLVVQGLTALHNSYTMGCPQGVRAAIHYSAGNEFHFKMKFHFQVGAGLHNKVLLIGAPASVGSAPVSLSITNTPLKGPLCP